MVLQHSSVRNSLHWHIITIILFNAKVGIFPPSYAVILSFISCFTTLYRFDLYFIFKLIILNILVFCYSIQLYYMCDCSIRVTAVLEYFETAKGCATISYFHCANIMKYN